jgi:hypothetical protein
MSFGLTTTMKAFIPQFVFVSSASENRLPQRHLSIGCGSINAENLMPASLEMSQIQWKMCDFVDPVQLLCPTPNLFRCQWITGEHLQLVEHRGPKSSGDLSSSAL